MSKGKGSPKPSPVPTGVPTGTTPTSPSTPKGSLSPSAIPKKSYPKKPQGLGKVFSVGCGCISALLIPILVITLISVVVHLKSEKDKMYEPRVGPIQVVGEIPFTIGPKGSKTGVKDFQVWNEPNNVLLGYTVEWKEFGEDSYLWSSIHGMTGANKSGADRLGFTSIRPAHHATQPPGSGVHNEARAYYVLIGNHQKDTVKGVFKFWGRKILPPLKKR